jgi:hypothetical protein
MAGLRVGPGVHDGDDGFAVPVLLVISHLHFAGTMAKGTQIVWREPAGAAQGFRSLFLVGHDSTFIGRDGAWPFLGNRSGEGEQIQ